MAFAHVQPSFAHFSGKSSWSFFGNLGNRNFVTNHTQKSRISGLASWTLECFQSSEVMDPSKKDLVSLGLIQALFACSE
jgi:hypothetical protein